MLGQRALLLLLLVLRGGDAAALVFRNRAALKTAVDACLAESSDGLCPGQQGGVPIGEWNVANVNDIGYIFNSAYLFNQDSIRYNPQGERKSTRWDRSRR